MRVLRAVLPLALVLAAVPTAAEATAPAIATAAQVSTGSTGSGRLGPSVTVDLSGTRALTSQGLLMAPSDGPMPESVIDFDTREFIANTTTWPFRATVLITFSYFGFNARCSGWMAAPNKVVTAGHCLAPGNGGRYFPATSYRIYPAAQGGNFGTVVAPFGACGATRLNTSPNWLKKGAFEGGDIHDVGVITLDCQIGHKTGWLGFNATVGDLAVPMQLIGYPGDKPFTLWRSRDRVRASEARRLFYAADTTAGMSGSPVVVTTSLCTRCVVAIHAYGVYDTGLTARYNHATRIDPITFRALKGWITA